MAGTQQLDASPEPRLTAAQRYSGQPLSLRHPGTVDRADHAPPHSLVPADRGPPRGCAGARSLGQLFPLFTPSRKEELVSKGKIRGIVLCGASSGISGGQETGTYSPLESDLQKDLEDVNLPPRASVSPPCSLLPRGLLAAVPLAKWGTEAGALPGVFGPQLQAMAWLPLLSVSSQQE